MVVEDMLSPDLLKRFQPFADLNEHQLLQLCGVVEHRELSFGEVIFECGDCDSREYFLVAGDLEFIAADGKIRKMSSSDTQAVGQLSRLRPRQYTVKAQGAATVLVVDKAVIDGLASDIAQKHPTIVGMSVDEDAEDEGPYSVLFEDFRADLEKNRCMLPSLPEVAMKVRKLLQDENSSVDQIARVVNADPAIAAKLIGAANSPVYHGSDNVDTTRNAIVRLGLSTTRLLIISYAMRDLFTSRSEALRLRMKNIWLCSVEVAAIAYVLTKKLKGISFSADEAMLAALLNDIGAIAIVNYLEYNPIWLEQGADIEDLVIELRADAGVEILRHWHFPESFMTAIREAEHWSRQHSGSVDMADVVQVSKLYAMMHNRQYIRGSNKLPPLAGVESLQKLQLGDMTPELTIAIVAEAREQIDAAKKMLLA